MEVTSQDVLFVAEFVQQLTGVVLDESKAYLIESRLAALARAAGCANYRDLCLAARSAGDRQLQNQIIDAITTHETLFFRDNSPFETLRQIAIPELTAPGSSTARRSTLRVWSAACSTGQEPYSIAMTLWETIPNISRWNVNILATDVSEAALRQATAGRYAAHQIQRGLNPQLLARFFGREGDEYVVRDEIRSMVSFRRQNLLESCSTLGPFDIIFCRNVAIYFDAAVRRQLFLRLAERLTPDGYLFVGSSESLTELGPRFRPQYHQRGAYYRPNLPSHAPPVPGAPSPVSSQTH